MLIRNLINRWKLGLLVCAFAANLAAGRVIYVDDDAPRANNGSSWKDAYVYLQDALTVARSGDEIRVAQGIYKPDRGAGIIRGDREASFHLIGGVAIRGGYAGFGEPDPDARDISIFQTVLSGDLNSDDDPNFTNTDDNSKNVVMSTKVDETAIIDGFTITGGSGFGQLWLDGGGGMNNRYGSSPTVVNCTFIRNQSELEGGGMLNYHESNPNIINCIFKQNSAMHGGGIRNMFYSCPTLVDCTFIKNRTTGGGGGGIANHVYCDPLLNRCKFIANRADFEGGALRNKDFSIPVINNCLFLGNSADRGGGLAEVNYCGSRLTNCTFALNTAFIGTVVVFDSYQMQMPSNIEFTNCILWDGSNQISSEDNSITTITHSNIRGSWPGESNIDIDPFLTPDGHLRKGSPCINALDPDLAVDLKGTPGDIDGDPRVINGRLDLGSDEFRDTDGDGLPDWWERQYFGDPIKADPNDDVDGDGLANIHEYEFYSSNPLAPPIYVNPSKGPFRTIQEAIDAAHDGDTVLVSPGIYSGVGNRDLDFGGKLIVLHAPAGPEATIIDCEHLGRGINFHSGETPAAAIIGFTITNGQAKERGSAIRCIQSHPQIRNCIITYNESQALYSEMSVPTLADCIFSHNESRSHNVSRGVWIDYGGAHIIGTVQIVSNDWAGYNFVLTGDGTLSLGSGTTLWARMPWSDDTVYPWQNICSIRCNLSGTGMVLVDLGMELDIAENAVVDLAGEGTIQCDGLLCVKDKASINNTNIEVTRASFEGDVNISNNIITAEAGAPYGQFFIEDTVKITGNEIYSDGDRYMDLDPSVFDGLIANNRIFVTVTEGAGQTRGGLLELRGQELGISPCGTGEFFCQVDSVPDFDPNVWTIDQLELIEGAKLNLTNRFDFQAPYGFGGDEEVLYVKQLILGPGSILNTAFNRLYYETLIMDPTAKIMNIPLLGFSLNNISFNDENEFLTRIKHNSFEHPENPAYNRVHVERVEGLEPDPNGMMQMCNLLDLDPESSSYQQVIGARAKGLFAKAGEDKILIEFEYLFSTSEPGIELVVYLTDVPELLEHNDPDRHDHYIKVAHLRVPPTGWPGSPGSGRFGVFHKYVERGKLNFIKGTRVEFELVGPAGACVYINNWDPQIHCNNLYCGDVTGDNGATVLDYLTVIANVGSPAGLLPDGTSTACLEFGFGVDGHIDTLDVSAWAWMLSREDLPNLCDIFLTPGMATLDAHVDTLSTTKNLRLQSALLIAYPLDALLISGKSGESDDSSKLEDNLYIFNDQGQYICKFKPESNYTNGRLVRDGAGEIYQVNHDKGLLRLSDGVCVIPPTTFTIDIEPRNGSNATISIGLHSESISYDDEPVAVWVGHPILDAAFDAEGYAYVTPVVVNPDGSEPYEVVARLQLINGENPPYRIVQLYDDPPASNDNKDQNNLREIEVSNSGNLYVINTENLNESDILWVYDIDTGQVIDRAELGNPYGDCFLPAPVAMHISNTRDMLYMASSQNDPNSICTSVYALSESDLSVVAVTNVNGMGHITDITEDPITGTLWIVGFTMPEIPDYLESNAEPFYKPYIAKISYDSSEVVEAVCLSDPILYPDNDLALPLSVMWTATEEKTINSTRTLANWRRFISTTPYLWSNTDFSDESNVTLNNLLTFCDSWLRENP